MDQEAGAPVAVGVTEWVGEVVAMVCGSVRWSDGWVGRRPAAGWWQWGPVGVDCGGGVMV